MAYGLEKIHQLKKEHSQILKAIQKSEKEIRNLMKQEPLYGTQYAEKRLNSMRNQLAEIEKKMVQSWQG